MHRRDFPLWGEGSPIDVDGLRMMREMLRCCMFVEPRRPDCGPVRYFPVPEEPGFAQVGEGGAPASALAEEDNEAVLGWNVHPGTLQVPPWLSMEADGGPGNAPAHAGDGNGPGVPPSPFGNAPADAGDKNGSGVPPRAPVSPGKRDVIICVPVLHGVFADDLIWAPQDHDHLRESAIAWAGFEPGH